MNLEICVDSVESAVAAEAGGAQRVELCTALAEGGITPSAGLLRAVRSRISIGLHVMIRPRGGDFLYSQDELSIMRDDIILASQSGADGVVLGLLKTSGDVDIERTRGLIDLARPMQVTFHRAFDVSRDMDAALEAIIETGADRILTSGAAINALAGGQRIAHLVQLANNLIQVMVAGSVRPENVAQIAAATHATHFHAALRTAIPSAMKHENRAIHLGAPGTDDYVRYVTQAEDVRRLRQAMDAVEAKQS